VLEVTDLDVRYGNVAAVKGISLRVDEREIVTIIGPNGAGKTTTLRAISGTVKTTGQIVFQGERLHRRTPEGMARRGIAHVPEGRGTFASLSVFDNMRLGAWTQRGPSARDLARVFEFFPVLYDRRDQQAGTLSGGEQQMVAMGRALMARPKMLLMDEPSMGLAPILVERSFEIIEQVHDSGVALLVVEQNANVSLSIADRGYVLSTGRVVLEGKAKDLLEHEELRKAYLGR